MIHALSGATINYYHRPMTTLDSSLLGKATVYAVRYDPDLLFPILRASKREEMGVGMPLPFHGVDLWNAYELSWLDSCGKPQLAVAEFRIPATSPYLIESKSLKLYLNSFSQEPISSAEVVHARLQRDLSAAAAQMVEVMLYPARTDGHRFSDLAGTSIDDIVVRIDDYGPPQAGYLCVDTTGGVTEEVLVSDLLRSNCPVTGQPDWASIQIAYHGKPMSREGLLRYLISFRTHSEFHEQCVERIFMDIHTRCVPQYLAVYARYTRRGGLDINPYRSSRLGDMPKNLRCARQ